MRWKQPVFGNKRVIKRFLFLPRKIKSETRWLETAYIKQAYDGYRWLNCEWVDKENEKEDVI